MPRDRLKELQEKATVNTIHAYNYDPPARKYDVESQPLINQDADFEMFLERCSNIRGGLKSLEEDYDAVVQLHGALLSTPGADSENSNKLKSHNQMFFSKAEQIKNSLKILSEETSRIPTTACGIMRAKSDQVKSIYKTFENIMLNFNREQDEYKEKAKRKIVDYLKIRNMQLSDEEIENAVSSGNLSEVTKGVMLALNEKKALYDEVKSRADELKNLERQMGELAQMFHDLHIMVVSQAKMVDSIVNSVENATEYAKQARGNVEEARNLQKRARKMKVCIIIGSIIAVLILILFIQSAVCHFTPIC
ncbi:Putative syntaxin-3 [Caenorhabditis elegans]|uniref:Putative syntaxin-3 n=1 Tax=Caenorhabditis elegans TaxID=6239 RepID=STX3_CAEEL|nr:Putative syntaxin-3 [Caenorhabditis elegans]Q20024.4 RecName: Full=Putative syntaxin-3 [Caenorhabditis elegans]CCD62783.2 Putative syntaxin-3 [Caenorhabditis elegans]